MVFFRQFFHVPLLQVMSRQAVLGCLPLALLGKLPLFPMGLGFASSLLSPEALNSP